MQRFYNFESATTEAQKLAQKKYNAKPEVKKANNKANRDYNARRKVIRQNFEFTPGQCKALFRESTIQCSFPPKHDGGHGTESGNRWS